ncbi:MAG: MFS transporter [Xanthobacteraceae bacterium]
MTTIEGVQTPVGTIVPAARRLSKGDVKTLSLSALGGALEFYDFVIFIYFTAAISKVFFPPDMPEWLRVVQTFGIFAAGYLARPIGGILFAHFGDLIGRKRMFALSIFLMALPCLAIGFLPTYATIGIAAPLLLLLFRIMQGAAIGGEVPGGWVFVAEHVPASRMGFGTAVLSSGIMVGACLGSMAAYLLHAIYTPAELLSLGWRVAFIAGGVFGLIAVYLRRWLEETPVFVELKTRGRLAKELPVWIVIREHKRAVLVLGVLTLVFSSAVVGVSLLAPTLFQSYFKIDPTSSFLASAMGTIIFAIGLVAGGASFDRFGAKSLIGWGIFYGVAYVVFFTLLKSNPALLFPLYALASFGAGALLGVVPPLTIPMFPAEVRFSGFSFSYNCSYAIFGSVTPFAMITSLQYTQIGPPLYIALMGALATLVGLYLVITGIKPEAQGNKVA